MTPNITDVKAQDNYEILLSIENGEMKIFDISLLLTKVFLNNFKTKLTLKQ